MELGGSREMEGFLCLPPHSRGSVASLNSLPLHSPGVSHSVLHASAARCNNFICIPLTSFHVCLTHQTEFFKARTLGFVDLIFILST